jgi:HK97 family phage major capsid protein
MEIKQLSEQILREFEGFKSDQKAQMDSRDALSAERERKHVEALAEMQKQLDEIQRLSARKGAASDEQAEKRALDEEHRKAFATYIQRGDARGLEALQHKGVSTTSDAEGGYAVSSSIDTMIERYAVDENVMRQDCSVITVRNERFEKLVRTDSAASGWVDETEARTETTAPVLKALTPFFGEIYAAPASTQRALDDMDALSVESWLAEEIGIQFASEENSAFTVGTGVKKPKGILSYTLAATADSSRTFGSIEKVASGSSGNFVASKLIDLVYAMHPKYAQGAKWHMSTLALAAIMKLTGTQNDHFMWQPSLAAGQPSTLLGYPIVVNQDVPVPAASANAAIFGNFKRGYQIVDLVNGGLRVIRDGLTNKPKVIFYATKRVGGHVVNDQAFKVMTLA